MIDRNYCEVNVIGVRFIPLNRAQLLAAIGAAVQQQERLIVLSGNAHSFNLAHEIPWLRDFFNSSHIVRIDGIGLRVAARLLGTSIPARMTWADFIWDLAGDAQEKGWSLYFLGGRPGVASTAEEHLTRHFPRLRITGTHHGYFNPDPKSAECRAVRDAIRHAGPDVLIVGMGMPRQERWLLENASTLDTPVLLTGGAVFDYASNSVQRPPRWMTNYGLEWLGRLVIEPGRLWRRYIFGNPRFLLRVVRQRLSRRPQ